MIGLVLLQALTVLAQDSIESEAVRQEGYYFTNPLLDCEPKLTYIPPFKQELSALVNKHLEDGSAKRISVYFRQLNNGYSFGVNENSRYTPASLLKVANAMYVMKVAESNPTVLEDTIKFQKRLDGPDSESKLVLGKSYMVKNLIYHMLVHSDNEAKSLLQLHFNNGGMWKEVFADLGIPIKVGAAFNNVISPKTYSILFRVLYNASYLNKKSSQILLKILSRTTFQAGIVSGIDDSQINIANKFGFRKLKGRCQLHESAIIYLAGNPYLVSIMTEGENEENLYSILRGISALVYRSCKTELLNNPDSKAPESLIHPLLDCSSDIEMLQPFKKQVNVAVEKLKSTGQATDVSVYFKHLTTGQGFIINGDTKYTPASTMKVPHMMTILKGAEGDPTAMDFKLSFGHEVSTNLQNIQDEAILIGKEYSVWELVERMIVYSDNLSADLLSENILNINDMWSKLLNDLGLRRVLTEESSTHLITIKELSVFFRVLYNATYLNRENSEIALKLLTKSNFQDGIRAGVKDDNVIVASKFGERSFDTPGKSFGIKELHDIGIVYLEGNPYILCVMTRGYDFNKQAQAISIISETIFNEMETQFPPED